MTGNISKSKGFKGDRGYTGETGPQGPQGEQGIQGEKGDTPEISFRYDEESGNLYYSSDGVFVDKEYVSSKDLASKEYVREQLLDLANKVAPSPASITLYADRWEQVSDGMWSQEVVVANATITEYSKVDLQLSAEQITIFYEKDLAFVTENDGGVITVFCIGRVPENDYVIQATVSEVLV